MAGLLVTLHSAVCSLRLSPGPLPSLLGRARGVSPGPVVDKGVDMPVIVPTLVQTRSRLWCVSQLQFLDKVCMPVVVQRQALWEVPQTQSIAELVDILFGNRDTCAQCKLCIPRGVHYQDKVVDMPLCARPGSRRAETSIYCCVYGCWWGSWRF